MPADLSGKVIVLTGGADGIGRECALAYAREGASVAILDRDLVRAVQTASEAGGDNIALPTDIGDGDAVRMAIRAVLKRLGASTPCIITRDCQPFEAAPRNDRAGVGRPAAH